MTRSFTYRQRFKRPSVLPIALDRITPIQGDSLEERCEKLTVVEVGLDLLGEYLQKQSVGPNYLALCPTSHKEQTPSFYLKPVWNFYTCYGCGNRAGPLYLPFAMGIPYPEHMRSPLDYLKHKIDLDTTNEADLRILSVQMASELIRVNGALQFSGRETRNAYRMLKNHARSFNQNQQILA